MEALTVAFDFIPPDGNFQAEGDGLGMHAVGAANLHGVFVLECELFECAG